MLDVNGVVTGVEKMLRRSLGENHVLELKLATDVGDIRADRGQLEQVLINLALNARDAMRAARPGHASPPGGPRCDEVYAQAPRRT